MKITSRTIGYAIHRVFVSQQIGQGCSLPLKALMEVWPETLLRRVDLGRGLEALRKAGHIAVEQQAPEGPALRLLDEEFGLVRTAQDQEAVAALTRLREGRRRPQAHLAALLGGRRIGRRSGEATGD